MGLTAGLSKEGRTGSLGNGGLPQQRRIIVSRAREVLDARAGAWVRRSGSVLLFTLATLGIVLGSSIASAQLNLSWVDNSGGQAGFILQRAQGTTGVYGQIAQTLPGVTSYADPTGSPGTTRSEEHTSELQSQS